MSTAISKLNDVVILDTAGRLHIDEALMEELKDLKANIKPHEILLVNDSINVYFKRMNLLFYVLQNNSSVKKILRKEEYQNNQELFQDMETMKEILKNAMIGEECIRNIALVSEKRFYFSGGGDRKSVV